MATRTSKAAAPPADSENEAIIAAVEEQSQPGKLFTRDVPLTGSPRFITFAGLYGNTFDRYTNPDTISFEQYNQMRRHGIVRAGLILIKAPILSCFKNATVTCADPKIKKWVEHNYLENGLLYRLARTSLRSLEFGAAFHEKRWEVEDQELTYTDTDPDTGEQIEDTAWSGPCHVIKEFHEVNPETVRYIMRHPQTRKFLAFVQSFAPTWLSTGGQPPLEMTPAKVQAMLPEGLSVEGIDGIPILAQKAFLYTRDPEFGNLWGESRLRSVWPYYFWDTVILKYWMAWAERKIVPTRVVRHPVGRAADGTDYSDVAIQLGELIDDVKVVTLANTREPASGVGVGAWHTQEYQWTFEEVTTTDKAETFKLVKDALESDMLRAMFVPERTFTTGQGFGLFSTDAQAHTDTFLMTEDAEAADLADSINEDAVWPAVLDNFGADAEKATIEIPGITDAHKEMLREIVMQALSVPGAAALLNLRAMLEQLQVPVTDIDESSPPLPGQLPQPGVSAGLPGVGIGGQPATGQNQPLSVPGGASQPGAGVSSQATPSNLLLDDAPIALETFDPTEYTVTPNPKALTGYSVVQNSTGEHLSGFAAEEVIKAFQTYSKRQNVAAGKRVVSAQTKAAKQAAAAQTKAQKQAAAALVKAQRADATRKKQAASAVQKQHSQIISSLKSQRNALQKTTSKQSPAQAVQTLTAAGLTVHATVGADGYATLTMQAEHMAQANPSAVYTIVKVSGGYVLASKGESSITPQSDNVALADSAGHAAAGLKRELLDEFAARIGKRLTKDAA